MEGPGLTALPVEVIHHISRYLSVQDVLSCSLTCQDLRAALNDNCVWRKYLPHNISDLGTREQQVSPRFQMGESLTPLCEMRQHFTRKNHLMRNWREGNYVRYSSSSEFGLENAELNEPGRLGNVIFKDKYVFLRRLVFDLDNSGIEIWDISTVPFLYTILKINYVAEYSFRIVECHLIINECTRVCVYRIGLPDKDFPLLYSFLVTDNNVTFNDIVDHEPHNENCKDSRWNHQFVRNYLMSTQCGSNRLHIWDIHNASKLGCFEPPLYASIITLHYFIGHTCWFQLIEMKISSNWTSCLVTFDLDSKQFSNNTFSLDADGHILPSCKSHIIVINTKTVSNDPGFYDVICTLYDFNTSTELRKIKIDKAGKSDIVSASQTLENGTFIIGGHDKCYVINALTLKIDSSFDHYDADPHFTRFSNIYDNVIAITISNAYTRPEQKLWNVSRKEVLLKYLHIKSLDVLYFDRLFTKLVISDYKTITVVHLW